MGKLGWLRRLAAWVALWCVRRPRSVNLSWERLDITFAEMPQGKRSFAIMAEGGAVRRGL